MCACVGAVGVGVRVGVFVSDHTARHSTHTRTHLLRPLAQSRVREDVTESQQWRRSVVAARVAVRLEPAQESQSVGHVAVTRRLLHCSALAEAVQRGRPPGTVLVEVAAQCLALFLQAVATASRLVRLDVGVRLVRLT